MRRHSFSLQPVRSFHVTLQNYGDVQYTGAITIGGQSLSGVFDTGSFELLVFSRECATCGTPKLLYSHNRSQTFVRGNLTNKHSFGSGDAWSNEAFDSVQLGPLRAGNQTFWEVVDTAMPVLSDSAFQVIVGFGPRHSARRLAEQEEEEERENRAAMAEAGLNMDPDDRAMEELHQLVVRAQGLVDLPEHLGLDRFAICIGHQKGEPGHFVLNEVDPRQSPTVFTQLPVAGSLHWSVELTDARVGHAPYGDDSVIDVGCGGSSGPCGAIFDSGTSLIAAPREAITQIEEAIEKLDGDCSKLDELPDLRFNLAGVEFSLPPDSYVGRVIGEIPSALAEFLHFKALDDDVHGRCQPLLMTVDAETQFGPMWILGIPFFRKYYTVFDSTEVNGSEGNSLFVAEADDACTPENGMSLLNKPRRRRGEPMEINPNHLHMPHWARHIVKQRRREQKHGHRKAPAKQRFHI